MINENAVIALQAPFDGSDPVAIKPVLTDVSVLLDRPMTGDDFEATTEVVARNQVCELKNLIEKAEVFFTPEGDVFVTVAVADHFETHPIGSQWVRDWLITNYFNAHGRAPSTQALKDVAELMRAVARFSDATPIEVFCRIALKGEKLYIDLCNNEWQVIEITPDGWKVLNHSPVKFRRSRTMYALPNPDETATSEDIAKLRPFLNAEDDQTWRLLQCWLLGATHPSGPYPILVIQGEQGSAKSTTSKALINVLDPSVVPLRTLPGTEKDLMIAAQGSWILAFDNLSGLTNAMSDSLCKISTGGAVTGRALYTDGEENVIQAKRPQILNGIDDIPTRQDLVDRSIVVTLPRVCEEHRKDEASFWKEFKEQHPAILGALCSILSEVLRVRPTLRLEHLPRLADFGLWVSAAEGALDLQPGDLLDAYEANREESLAVGLEHDAFGSAIATFMRYRREWTGTATELLDQVKDKVDDSITRSNLWPKPNRVRNRLKRNGTPLRALGITFDFPPRGATERTIKLMTMPVTGATSTVTNLSLISAQNDGHDDHDDD